MSREKTPGEEGACPGGKAWPWVQRGLCAPGTGPRDHAFQQGLKHKQQQGPPEGPPIHSPPL